MFDVKGETFTEFLTFFFYMIYFPACVLQPSSIHLLLRFQAWTTLQCSLGPGLRLKKHDTIGMITMQMIVPETKTPFPLKSKNALNICI